MPTDVSKSPDAKHKFINLQNEYHKLDSYISNPQFLNEWKLFKKDGRLPHSFHDTHAAGQSTDWDSYRNPLYREDGTESAGRGRYYYHHSDPYARPEPRNLDDDPFEQYRQYYEWQARQQPSSNATRWRRGGYRKWNDGNLQLPFLLSPLFLFFLTFVIPAVFLSRFFKRRNHESRRPEDERWVISREIKNQLWEELKASNLTNRGLSFPTSYLLLSLDSDRPLLTPPASSPSSFTVTPLGSKNSGSNQEDLSHIGIPPLSSSAPSTTNTDAVSHRRPNETTGAEHHLELSSPDHSADRAARQAERNRETDRIRKLEYWQGDEQSLPDYMTPGTVFPATGEGPIGRRASSAGVKRKPEQRKNQQDGSSVAMQDPYYYTRQDKWNRLHRAVIKKDFDHCLYLLLGGLNSGFLDRKNRTALHYAAHSGQTDLCRLLLLFNANPLSPDGYLECPIDAARQAGWKDIERLLIFAATGSYQLAVELANTEDLKQPYSKLFASYVPASLSTYIPSDIPYHMARLRHSSFR